MISEPRKIKLLESVVEAGKRWKLVKLLDVCDWFAVFSVRTSHRLVEDTYFHRPYRSKPAEYLFELAWGVNTRKRGPMRPPPQIIKYRCSRQQEHDGTKAFGGCSRRSGGSLIAKEMSRLSPDQRLSGQVHCRHHLTYHALR
ncbi:hypothetical protein PAPYR_3354 [Paratrimastix pyriformis]|uniref:Uncharacterized protein n=1 Tax=Paratrimastix pyriformis TaxID=342808 RepID=A0ABQ8UPF5_9EUKA|nr:hypothetical protein PAPYR_3354 [Paratrimastix pyriformis]